MALRRPPTRIELKPDDIEEYDEIQRERQMAVEEAASAVAPGHDGAYNTRKRGGKNKTTTPSPHSTNRKLTAQERIGIKGGGGGGR
mmetsp:Transcript_29938/g.44523  ORF Transcript_29938/g.44523 Transcript_29938/m.44523 type:complete len:86 (-) Transcript_29938:629-886(-)